jgi:MFS family permease
MRTIREAFASNLRNRELRRSHLSFGAAWTSEWALTVGLGIVAFDHGGAAAVGLVALLRFTPGAIVGPFAAAIADRVRREWVIAAIGVIRAAAISAMAVLLAGGAPIALLYALAAVSSVAMTPFRAAHSALLPSLCNTPEQLTSANVVRGMIDSVSTLVGPAIAAVLLTVGSPASVFAAAAASSLWSALVIARLDYEAPPKVERTCRTTVVQDVGDGFRALNEHRDVALLIGMAGAQTFTRGCLNVLTVIAAIDVLHMGHAGVGVLTAAVGVGGVVGSLGASMLVTSRRLGAWFGISIALWGLPLIGVGAVPQEAPTLALLTIIGLGNAILDVSGFTVIARLAPDEVLARLFGIFEAMVALTMGLGSILTPVVIGAVGVRGALVVLGSLCPLLAVLAWTRLRSIDRSIREREAVLAHMRAVPILRPLPVAVMDGLARQLRRASLSAGETVFRQGETGDRFYVIASGEAEVVHDSRRVSTLRANDSFGEIALLRDVPRTAEVRARTALDVYALDRDAFVRTINGYRSATALADSAIDEMLAALARLGHRADRRLALGESVVQPPRERAQFRAVGVV